MWDDSNKKKTRMVIRGIRLNSVYNICSEGNEGEKILSPKGFFFLIQHILNSAGDKYGIIELSVSLVMWYMCH